MAAAGKAEAGNGACTGIKNGVSLKAGSGFIPGSACSSVTGSRFLPFMVWKKGMCFLFFAKTEKCRQGSCRHFKGSINN
jgi:hypothetical protein